MGTKFANIQVREKDLKLVEEALRNYINNSNKKLLGRIFSLIMDSMNYYIGSLEDGWITIPHDSFEWETIEWITLDFSNFCKGNILAIGYYDDDVFIMSLVNDGKILTRHVSGNVEEYDLEQQMGDIDLFIKELDLHIKSDDLMEILKKDDLEEKVSDLEELLSVPLWIKSEWLSDMDDETIKKFKAIRRNIL